MTHQEITQAVHKIWFGKPKERNIIIHTGAGGMDLFDEMMEESAGFKRIPIGKKVLRILRRLKPVIRKNRTGIYYKLVSNGKVFQ